MTVSSSVNKIVGAGNGVTTVWPFSFKVFDATHLTVIYTDAVGADTTLAPSAYVVALNADQNNNPGGTVTYAPAIAAGTALTILRVVPYTQEADIENQGAFYPSVLERAYDLLAMQIQQIKEQIARALKLSPSQSAISDLNATDANRASTFLGFDVSGALALFTGLASMAVSLAMQPVIAAATLALARTAMGVGDGQVTNARLASVAGFSLKGQLLGSAAAVPVDLTQGQALAGLMAWVMPGHRLTLTTALDVTVADVTAATTIFWTPSKSNLSPIYDGTTWILAALAEKSFILDAANHLLGKNYDVFLDYNAGAPRLLTSPAWTNDIARADAIGRDATYSFRVNNASITCRISNNGGTVVKGAGSLLYLGTIRCAANGQAEDSVLKRFVWNMYNRVARPMRAFETTDSWSYNTGTIRQSNANAAMQLDFVRGLDEDAAKATAISRWSNDTVGQAGFTLIGLDSTTAAATGCLMVGMTQQAASQGCVSSAEWNGLPGLGRHYLACLERGSGVGTQNWAGDGGLPTFLQTGITGEVFA